MSETAAQARYALALGCGVKKNAWRLSSPHFDCGELQFVHKRIE